MSGVDLIAAERIRQVEKEQWTADHDDSHDDSSLAVAAACYASPFRLSALVPVPCGCREADCPHEPFGKNAWRVVEPFGEPVKHTGDRIRQLAIAGALVAAEIDRLQRQDPLAEASWDLQVECRRAAKGRRQHGSEPISTNRFSHRHLHRGISRVDAVENECEELMNHGIRRSRPRL